MHSFRVGKPLFTPHKMLGTYFRILKHYYSLSSANTSLCCFHTPALILFANKQATHNICILIKLLQGCPIHRGAIPKSSHSGLAHRAFDFSRLSTLLKTEQSMFNRNVHSFLFVYVNKRNILWFMLPMRGGSAFL